MVSRANFVNISCDCKCHENSIAECQIYRKILTYDYFSSLVGGKCSRDEREKHGDLSDLEPPSFKFKRRQLRSRFLG